MSARALLCVLVVALALPVSAQARHTNSLERPRSVNTPAELVKYQKHLLEHHAYVATHGKGRPKFVSKHALHWISRELRETMSKLYVISLPPHHAAWNCIHHYEGSWTDDGAPYWGGLQMDMSFQQAYGAELLRTKGTANHWTPLEQMWVAERAYRSGRGFYPWPNTARSCGLL